MTGLSTLRRSAAAILVLAVIAVSPAAVAAAVPDRGDHGAQARCLYKSVELEGWAGAMRLNRLTVQPPTLFAIEAPSKVGWRLIVQRRPDFGTWKTIFTSARQTAPATPTTPADLSPLSALIDSPLFVRNGSGDYIGVDYRAALKFYWFNSDGSTRLIERHRVRSYDTFRAGAYQWTDTGACHHAWVFP
jgi:hypothetical protein